MYTNRKIQCSLCLQALTAVQETSEGDLRKAITTLQSAYRLKGDLEIAAADVYELSGVPITL